jgi:hypothetical protein
MTPRLPEYAAALTAALAELDYAATRARQARADLERLAAAGCSDAAAAAARVVACDEDDLRAAAAGVGRMRAKVAGLCPEYQNAEG